MITTTLGAAIAACAIAGAPYAHAVSPHAVRHHAPGHGIYSDITSGVPLTNAALLYPQPYPYRRTATRTYTNSGRLWTPYTAQEKILSTLFPGGGPAALGAPLSDADAVIFVRPQSEPYPDIGVSPWQHIDEQTLESIWRRRPWLQRSPSRTEDLIDELRQAQNRFLEQQGLIKHVRTHVNARSLSDEGEKQGQGEVEPSAIIRRHERPAPNPNRLRTSVPPVTRISLPGQTTTTPRITVVRQESEGEPTDG